VLSLVLSLGGGVRIVVYCPLGPFDSGPVPKGVAMPHRKPELDRIIKDLQGFIAQSCQVAPGQAQDFVGETCNDAYLMLEQARKELEKEEREEPAGD